MWWICLRAGLYDVIHYFTMPYACWRQLWRDCILFKAFTRLTNYMLGVLLITEIRYLLRERENQNFGPPDRP